MKKGEWFTVGVLVLGAWFVIYGLTNLVGNSLGFGIEEKVNLAQVVVEMVLIPVAAIAFWQTKKAFDKAAALPDLQLGFLGEDGRVHDEYTVAIPEGGGHANRVSFAIINNGEQSLSGGRCPLICRFQ